MTATPHMLEAPADPTGGVDPWDFATSLADASPAVMLAIFIFALLKRWLVLPRELDSCQARITELEQERDEFKSMAFKALDVGERVTSAVEERDRDRR